MGYLVVMAITALMFSVPYELGKTIEKLEKEHIYNDF